MTDTKKILVSTAGVVLLGLAVVIGAETRNWADGGRNLVAYRDEFPVDGLMASRDNSQDVPEGDYYYELTQLLKREYVEPITDEQKLASGAVRGMIGSLGDPKSLYMDKDEFESYLNARQGKYEGVGAEFALVVSGPVNKEADKEANAEAETAEEALVTAARIPRLTVVGLTPDGPAAKAGVKVGDIVYSVDGHWLVNTDLFLKFRKAQRDFDAKKIPLSALSQLRNEIRDKTQRALLPLRAKSRLADGTAGAVDVVWERNGVQRHTSLNKALSTMPTNAVAANGAVTLRFTPDAPAFLKKAIAGKREVTIDLRDNALGDLGVMKQCLAILAPAGKYGVVATNRPEAPTPFAIKTGNSKPPKLNLLVDSTTRGPAEIFALALSNFDDAKLVGSETGGDRSIVQVTQLPDGTGYTLVTGDYRVHADAGRVAKGGKA